MWKSLSANNLMYLLICVVVFFTTSDLIASFTNHLTIASLSSILSGLAVFIGAYKLKVIQLDNTVDMSIDFIKKNFSKSSIIFSILDIICSIIALFTGIIIIGLIFRATFAIRIVVILNKFQTITRFILVGSLIYLIRRCCLMSELKMSKEQWIVLGIFCAGFVYGILSSIFPQIAIFVDPALQALLCCGIEGVVGAVGIFMKGANKTPEEIQASAEKLASLSDKRIEKMAVANAKAELKSVEEQQLKTLTEKHKSIIIEQQAQAKAEAEAKAKAELQASNTTSTN